VVSLGLVFSLPGSALSNESLGGKKGNGKTQVSKHETRGTQTFARRRRGPPAHLSFLRRFVVPRDLGFCPLASCATPAGLKAPALRLLLMAL